MTQVTARVVTANTDFTRAHNKDYVHQLAGWGDVMLLQEAKDMDLAKTLPDGWAHCHDTSSEAKAGTAVGVNKAVFRVNDWWLEFGAPPPDGGGMLTRYILVVVLEHKETGLVWSAISAHLPPKRYSELQPGYTANLKKAKDAQKAKGRRVIVGTDANMPLQALANKIGGKPYGEGIVGLITGQPTSKVTVHHWGQAHNLTDHPAISGRTELT